MMDKYIERETMTTGTPTGEKIKAFNPHIVVGENIDKPYYSICYYDVEKKEWFIGYSSYNLAFVAKWLKDFFEKVEVDMTEVVRCKDCQYGKGNDYEGSIKVPFMYHCTYDDLSYNGADHFCSYGKKKEGAEE